MLPHKPLRPKAFSTPLVRLPPGQADWSRQCRSQSITNIAHDLRNSRDKPTSSPGTDRRDSWANRSSVSSDNSNGWENYERVNGPCVDPGDTYIYLDRVVLPFISVFVGTYRRLICAQAEERLDYENPLNRRNPNDGPGLFVGPLLACTETTDIHICRRWTVMGYAKVDEELEARAVKKICEHEKLRKQKFYAELLALPDNNVDEKLEDHAGEKIRKHEKLREQKFDDEYFASSSSAKIERGYNVSHSRDQAFLDINILSPKHRILSFRRLFQKRTARKLAWVPYTYRVEEGDGSLVQNLFCKLKTRGLLNTVCDFISGRRSSRSSRNKGRKGDGTHKAGKPGQFVLHYDQDSSKPTVVVDKNTDKEGSAVYTYKFEGRTYYWSRGNFKLPDSSGRKHDGAGGRGGGGGGGRKKGKQADEDRATRAEVPRATELYVLRAKDSKNVVGGHIVLYHSLSRDLQQPPDPTFCSFLPDTWVNITPWNLTTPDRGDSVKSFYHKPDAATATADAGAAKYRSGLDCLRLRDIIDHSPEEAKKRGGECAKEACENLRFFEIHLFLALLVLFDLRAPVMEASLLRNNAAKDRPEEPPLGEGSRVVGDNTLSVGSRTSSMS